MKFDAISLRRKSLQEILAEVTSRSGTGKSAGGAQAKTLKSSAAQLGCSASTNTKCVSRTGDHSFFTA